MTMRLAIERRAPGIVRPRLFEIVTPRTNPLPIAAAEHFLSALALAEPFSRELAATREARWLLVRTESEAMERHTHDQLAAAYPQSDLRPIDLETFPSLDPALARPNEQTRTCVMLLRARGYLPLRTFADADASGTAWPDPVASLLAALGSVPSGWRALSQLVFRPAPFDWCKGYQRLAIEHALAPEQRLEHVPSSSPDIVHMLAALCAVGVVGGFGYSLVQAGAWLPLVGMSAGVAGAGGGLFTLKRKLGRRELYDMRLVQEKIEHSAYVAELRLSVFAPASVAAAQVNSQLRRIAAAYGHFNLASGNGLAPRDVDARHTRLCSTAPLVKPGKLPVLNVRELAGLWHPPNDGSGVPLLERTAARRYLPLPYALSRGRQLGLSCHHGHIVPVLVADEALARNMFAIGKTGYGKSTWMEIVIEHLLAGPLAGGDRPAILIIDPHEDLARNVIGRIPPALESSVVYVDASNEQRPFGLNLLDTGLGWDLDSAVNAALTVFEREFWQAWGYRMESSFRYALRTLYQANLAICAADPHTGRRRQFTILHVPELLVDPAFRRSVIGLTNDRNIVRWWTKYFDTMDRHLQAEVINPVQTKIHKFAGTDRANRIVGQACSTIDPKSWIASGAVVVVNTAAGAIGASTAGLLGSVLVNLVSIALAEQSALDRRERRRLTMLVDEMHIMPGISYETIVSELGKYGANLIAATQSLARLDALDDEQERALRAALFSNIDGLFVFQVSAEDAAFLVPELGPNVEVEDLVSLPKYECYARLTADGQRLPAFSMRLDLPPASDAQLRQRLAEDAGLRYGRDKDGVDEEIEASFARIDALHQVPDEGGIARDAPDEPETPGERKARNQHRKGRRKAAPHEATPPEKAATEDETELPHSPEPGEDGESEREREP